MSTQRSPRRTRFGHSQMWRSDLRGDRVVDGVSERPEPRPGRQVVAVVDQDASRSRQLGVAGALDRVPTSVEREDERVARMADRRARGRGRDRIALLPPRPHAAVAAREQHHGTRLGVPDGAVGGGRDPAVVEHAPAPASVAVELTRPGYERDRLLAPTNQIRRAHVPPADRSMDRSGRVVLEEHVVAPVDVGAPVRIVHPSEGGPRVQTRERGIRLAPPRPATRTPA